MKDFIYLAGPVINGYAFCDIEKQKSDREERAQVDDRPSLHDAARSRDSCAARRSQATISARASTSSWTEQAKEEAHLDAMANVEAMKKKRRENDADVKYCWRRLEPAVLIVLHGLEDLLVAVHHERAVLRDRLVQRLARDQQHARGRGRRERDAIRRRCCRGSPCAAPARRCPRPSRRRGRRRRTRCAPRASACANVAPAGSSMSRYSGSVTSRCIAPSTPWLAPATTRTRTPSSVVNSGISSVAMSRYQGARILSFAGRLSQSWKPSMRPSSCSGSSEWMMPRPGGHPLHAAVGEQALVARVVAMAHAPGDHVRHRLEPAVRMVRKAADVVLGIVGAERIEHQERIEPALQRLRQHARELHARAVRRRLAGDHALDRARLRHALVVDGGRCRHGSCPFVSVHAATASSISAYAVASASRSASAPIARPSA